MLQVQGIRKVFAENGVTAVDDVTFSVAAGEVVGLVGENGAGKSTLLGVLAGALAPSAGMVRLEGINLRTGSVAAARSAGIRLVPQHPGRLEGEPVWRNLLLDARGPVLVRRARAYDLAKSFTDDYDVHLDLEAPAGSLTAEELFFVHLMSSVQPQPRVLLLDEPGAFLNPAHTDRLGAVLRRLTESGTAVLVVSHKLETVRGLTDRILVMASGRIVADRAAAGLSEDELVRLAFEEAKRPGSMIPDGGGRRSTAASGGAGPRPPVLAVTGLEAADTLEEIRGLDLSLAPGETVAIALRRGTGAYLLEDVLVGLSRPRRGSISLDGIDLARGGAAARRERGLAYIPGDRIGRGVALSASVAENLAACRPGGFPYSRPALARFVPEAAAIGGFPDRPDAPAGTLSGGNISRLIIARELAHPGQIRLAVVSRPSLGLDHSGVELIARLLDEVQEAGGAVLLFSNDEDEILRFADRVLRLGAARGGVTSRLELGDKAESRRDLRRLLSGGGES